MMSAARNIPHTSLTISTTYSTHNRYKHTKSMLKLSSSLKTDSHKVQQNVLISLSLKTGDNCPNIRDSFFSLCLDSYDQAIKRQQRAQMTSDLSADESLDDRATRHQRCRLEFSADEHEVQTKKRSKSSVTEVATALKTNPLPQVPLPPGLQCSGECFYCYVALYCSDNVVLETIFLSYEKV